MKLKDSIRLIALRETTNQYLGRLYDARSVVDNMTATPDTVELRDSIHAALEVDDAPGTPRHIQALIDRILGR